MNYFLPLIGVFCIAVALAAFMYVKRTAKPTNARPDATEVSHPVTPPDAPPGEWDANAATEAVPPASSSRRTDESRPQRAWYA